MTLQFKERVVVDGPATLERGRFWARGLGVCLRGRGALPGWSLALPGRPAFPGGAVSWDRHAPAWQAVGVRLRGARAAQTD
jgi:hypothetical protein